MSWRMTVVLPSEFEQAVRKEQFQTRMPISRLIKSMLAERYGIEDEKQKTETEETKNAS